MAIRIYPLQQFRYNDWPVIGKLAKEDPALFDIEHACRDAFYWMMRKEHHDRRK